MELSGLIWGRISNIISGDERIKRGMIFRVQLKETSQIGVLERKRKNTR